MITMFCLSVIGTQIDEYKMLLKFHKIIKVYFQVPKGEELKGEKINDKLHYLRHWLIQEHSHHPLFC